KHGRFEDEGWRLRKDGTAFWANVIITALHDAEGRLRGFAKVTRDMTERKRVEALERGEQEMNEFLAMLAHELRNPLAPIRNALDLMRIKSAGDSTQEWSRNVIDRQLTQLTRLVDDLLDVGRITSGKIALSPAARSPCTRSPSRSTPPFFARWNRCSRSPMSVSTRSTCASRAIHCWSTVIWLVFRRWY
ncbi:MAG: PAS domain S-box protein, partial [Betaproteobacteria bacterium]